MFDSLNQRSSSAGLAALVILSQVKLRELLLARFASIWTIFAYSVVDRLLTTLTDIFV
jgi:hypothetical protein